MFEGCTSLTAVDLPENVTTIGSAVFKDCTSLASVTFGSFFKELGNDAFRGCISLEEVNIPDQVTAIGSQTFFGCTNLKKVVVGTKMRTLGDQAFASCENLTEFYCYTPEPPMAYTGTSSMDTFKDSYIEYVDLFVGKPYVDAYKAKEPWKSFQSIEGVDVPMPQYQLIYFVNNKLYKTVLWREGDVIVPDPGPVKAGYKFEGWLDIPEIMPGQDTKVYGWLEPYDCDVNGDGVVNIADIVALTQYIISQSGVEKEKADVNDDGVVDANDIIDVIGILSNDKTFF